MDITTDQIKALRDKTGISIMQCKSALEEAEGDVEKAVVILRKKGTAAVAKKSDRDLGAGVVQAYIHNTNQVGTLVMLSCETDFVSKNPDFIELARDIAMHAAASTPSFIGRDEVTEDKIATARSVFEGQAADKPEEMRAKIVEGKLDSYLKESVLLEQPFIKNPDLTVQGLIEEATHKFGERIEVSKLERFAISD